MKITIMTSGGSFRIYEGQKLPPSTPPPPKQKTYTWELLGEVHDNPNDDRWILRKPGREDIPNILSKLDRPTKSSFYLRTIESMEDIHYNPIEKEIPENCWEKCMTIPMMSGIHRGYGGQDIPNILLKLDRPTKSSFYLRILESMEDRHYNPIEKKIPENCWEKCMTFT